MGSSSPGRRAESQQIGLGLAGLNNFIMLEAVPSCLVYGPRVIRAGE